MALMLCDISQVTNTGEAAFFYACQEHLDPGIVVYHNREVGGLEFDFCLLMPNVGVLIVEVKGWSEKTVRYVAADGRICIQKDGRDSLENPRSQARGYRFALLNKIKSRTGKCPLIFSMVCYPNIGRDFAARKGFEANCEVALTFFKEDLQSREAFAEKLRQACAQVCDWNVDPFNPLLMGQVRALFEPDYQEAESEPAASQTEGRTNRIVIPSSLCYPGAARAGRPPLTIWSGVMEREAGSSASSKRWRCRNTRLPDFDGCLNPEH